MLKPGEDGDELAVRPRHGFTTEAVRIGTPVLILAAGVVGFLALSSLRRAPARESRVVQPPPVETVPAQLHDQGVDIKVDGLVVPYREINVSAEVAGRIKFKASKCRAGNHVARGTLLIEIDPADYRLEVRRLSVEVRQAQVMLDELDVQVTNTEQLIKLATQDVEIQHREVARLEGLDADQTVSETKFDQARLAELTAKNALQSLRNQLRQLEASRQRLVQGRELAATQLEKAELDLKRTKVIAPTDGQIVRDTVEQDSYVQKGATLFVLEDTASVEVKCSLRMKELFWVWQQSGPRQDSSEMPDLVSGYQIPATPVTVTYRLGVRRYAWDGVLSRYEGLGLDERTRTVPCRVVVDQPRQARLVDDRGVGGEPAIPPTLVRGMYVAVLVHTRPNLALLRVPEKAVRPGNVVWLVEDGRLRRHKIQVSQIVDDGVLVDAQYAGFHDGARVVVSPLASTYDGMAVREVPSS